MGPMLTSTGLNAGKGMTRKGIGDSNTWKRDAGSPSKKSSDELERNDFSSNHHPALALYLSMIFSENRFPLFGIML
jgi:hypothetical protein